MAERWRDGVALLAMRATNASSRVLGRGEGTVAGGRVGMALSPRLLGRLAAGRTVALVSGTNGKTTTTALLAAALSDLGEVATNDTGSNMPEGHAAALGARRDAPMAVLECDEVWLDRVAAATRPAAVVLLNLSRDQLDRTSEVRHIAARWREALEDFGGVCVANADDPLVVHAAEVARHVVFYAGGLGWTGDAGTCPRCGAHLALGGEWSCSCGFARPPAVASPLEAGAILDGVEVPFELQLPGAFNRANATAALLCASRLGASPSRAAAALSGVAEVAGRFSMLEVDGVAARLMLAKNPAGWQALLDVVAADSGPAVLVVNARVADGHDPSWLYDVAFERLAGRRVFAAGERWRDLSTRLFYGGVPHEVRPDPREAIVAAGADPGPRSVEVIANYTAFADLRARARSRR